MFAVTLRRVYYTCDKLIVRNLRNKRPDTTPNPGLQNRLDAFLKDGVKVQDNDAEEFVEQSASEFYKVGEVYNEHLNETLIGKLELRHHIVKEKYFKENMPNLLTWSEKEQIRHLASTDPDEWTPEKIAESFPITVPVVKKLLKYPWKPASEQRITRHDASAMRNWKELKEGTLSIPEDLRNRFLKFSERSIPPLRMKPVKVDVSPTEDLGEFERIVQRCAQNDSGHTSEASANVSTPGRAQNKKGVKNDTNIITLEALTEKIKKRMESGNDIQMPDQIMLDSVQHASPENSENLSSEIELLHENKNKQVQESKEKDPHVITISDYPQRIRIPKKAHKKDATYKVNDCYYDHDGRFMYRVIGMSR